MDSCIPLLFANSTWLSVRSITRDACVLCFFLSFFFFRYLSLALVFCYKTRNKFDIRPKLADTDFWRVDVCIGAHLDFRVEMKCAVIFKLPRA
jgi:hypothetical protein